MRKAIRHIIHLCIMLLSSSPFFAHTLVTTSPLSSTVIKLISAEKSSCQIDIENIFTDQSSIKDTVFEIYQKKEILTSDNEEEDTETMSAKKDLDKTSCYISFFNQQNAESFTAYFKEPLASSKELSYLPSSNSSLYIIFEVFRI